MSIPKVTIEKGRYFEQHNEKTNKPSTGIRNVMTNINPNNRTNEYCPYHKMENSPNSFIYQLFVKKLNKGVVPNPGCFTSQKYLDTEELKRFKKYFNIIDNNKIKDKNIFKYTRLVSKNNYKLNSETYKNCYHSEKFVQYEIKKLLEYMNIKVKDEVEVTKPLDNNGNEYPIYMKKEDDIRFQKQMNDKNNKNKLYTRGQCDLLLNTVVVELKCINTMNNYKNGEYSCCGGKTMSDSEFWLRVILQAWRYIERFEFEMVPDMHNKQRNPEIVKIKKTEEKFTKIAVTNGCDIILAKVCSYKKGDDIYLKVDKIFEHTMNNLTEHPLRYNRYEPVIDLPKIAQCIAWFNFYRSIINEDDVLNDFLFFVKKNGIIELHSLDIQDYKNKVAADWENSKINFDKIKNKAIYYNCIRHEMGGHTNGKGAKNFMRQYEQDAKKSVVSKPSKNTNGVMNYRANIKIDKNLIPDPRKEAKEYLTKQLYMNNRIKATFYKK